MATSTLPTPTPTRLCNLLEPLVPAAHQGFGWQSWIAQQLQLRSRQTFHDWLRHERVPAIWIDALCELLQAPAEVREELRRRAGVRPLAKPALPTAEL